MKEMHIIAAIKEFPITKHDSVIHSIHPKKIHRLINHRPSIVYAPELSFIVSQRDEFILSSYLVHYQSTTMASVCFRVGT